jgi:hypothetical protein
VQQDNGNLVPNSQPVLAFVSGTACGTALTRLAPSGPETPPEDADHTVYALKVLSAVDRAGCGLPGASVSLYFPQLGRMANESTPFADAERRLNLTLGPPLGNRLIIHYVSGDGPP